MEAGRGKIFEGKSLLSMINRIRQVEVNNGDPSVISISVLMSAARNSDRMVNCSNSTWSMPSWANLRDILVDEKWKRA